MKKIIIYVSLSMSCTFLLSSQAPVSSQAPELEQPVDTLQMLVDSANCLQIERDFKLKYEDFKIRKVRLQRDSIKLIQLERPKWYQRLFRSKKDTL